MITKILEFLFEGMIFGDPGGSIDFVNVGSCPQQFWFEKNTVQNGKHHPFWSDPVCQACQNLVPGFYQIPLPVAASQMVCQA